MYLLNQKTKTKTQKRQNMNTYVVAIPSYNRAHQLIVKTLATLKKGRIPSKIINIFVANDIERAIYFATIPTELYGRIIVGVKGITPQRQYIVNYFEEDTHVVSIDDDVEDVLQLSPDGTTLTCMTNLDEFFRAAFERCVTAHLHLWGVYPVKNPYFMRPKSTTDLKFILGTMYGFICRHDADLVPTVAEKEDYEMSILYYLKDDGVLRYNNVCLKTKFHAAGGLGNGADRFETNRVAAETLQQRYPDLVKIRERKSGMTEIRLYAKKEK